MHRVESQKLIAYNSNIIKLLFLIFLDFGKRHLNTIELARCVVHVFYGLMTVCLKNPRHFILPLKTLWRYICWSIVAIFLIDLPLFFHYVLSAYIFIKYFSKLWLIPRTVPSLDLTDKCIISSFSICISHLPWSLVKIRYHFRARSLVVCN